MAFVVLAVSFSSAPAHAEVGKKLKEGLTASSPKVRIVAAAGVAKTKDPQARALLEPLLKDSDSSVRAAVVDALGKLGDPAAIPALDALSGDSDETVQAILKRVLPELKSSRVMVFIGKGEDYSGNRQALGEMLRKKTRDSLTQRLGAGYVLHEDATLKSYGASPVAVRSVVKRVDGSVTFVDVKCELTLVEMPGNILRAALSTVASVGVEGKVNEKVEAELARDGVNECASSLASDFVSYVRERSRR